MRQCSVGECGRKVVSNDLCDTHYRRFRKGTDLTEPIRRWDIPKFCSVDGCNIQHKAKGYCNGHYQQFVLKGSTTPLQMRNKDSKCGLPRCVKEASSKGLCSTHSRIMYGHGLTPDRYVELMKGVCQICGSNENLVIDHDHGCCNKKWGGCGKCVRGVLCSACNKGLGFFRDDRYRLTKAIEYLHSGNV